MYVIFDLFFFFQSQFLLPYFSQLVYNEFKVMNLVTEYNYYYTKDNLCPMPYSFTTLVLLTSGDPGDNIIQDKCPLVSRSVTSKFSM